MCTTKANGETVWRNISANVIRYWNSYITSTGTSVTLNESNTKTISKLKDKISALKSYLDCEISALNYKTNTVSASIDLALKAIEETCKSKAYAYVTVPTHISDELMKVNGLEFTSKNGLIKKAQKTHQNNINFPVK